MCPIKIRQHFTLLTLTNNSKIKFPNIIINNLIQKTTIFLKNKILPQLLINKIFLSLQYINNLFEIMYLHRIIYMFQLN